MTDAIEKIDLNSAAQQLRDKIKLAFVEVLPDEQWEAMIRQEIHKFVTKPPRERWSNEDRPSQFSNLAQDVLKEHIQERLRKTLNDPGWRGWPDNVLLSAYVGEWLEGNKEQIVELMVKSTMGAALQAAINTAAQNTAIQIQQQLNDLNR